MNNRIKTLRSSLGLTQEEFASKLGVKRNTIGNYETGNRIPSNQTITSICREFGVNEEWLRNGCGKMFPELSRSELAARVVGTLLSTDDEFIQSVLISLGELSSTEWAVIKKFVEKLKG